MRKPFTNKEKIDSIKQKYNYELSFEQQEKIFNFIIDTMLNDFEKDTLLSTIIKTISELEE